MAITQVEYNHLRSARSGEGIESLAGAVPSETPTTASPTSGYTYGNVCEQYGLVCNEGSLALQTGNDAEAVCTWQGLSRGLHTCEAATDPARVGCYVDYVKKECYYYSGTLTCSSPVTTPDWYSSLQLYSCVDPASSIPSLAPTHAPVVKVGKTGKSGKGQGGKDGPGPKGVKGSSGPTYSERCAARSKGTRVYYCSDELLASSIDPAVCQALFSSSDPCLEGKDPKGAGCYGDTLGHCLVYRKPKKCSDIYLNYIPHEVSEMFEGNQVTATGCARNLT